MNTPEPMILLVDSHHGIYCYQSLAERYVLCDEDGKSLPQEDIDGLKGDDWCETIDWLGDIYTESLDGKLHLVESMEGDIWAIHPDATWCEQADTYVIDCDCDSAHCPANP